MLDRLKVNLQSHIQSRCAVDTHNQLDMMKNEVALCLFAAVLKCRKERQYIVNFLKKYCEETDCEKIFQFLFNFRKKSKIQQCSAKL